MMSKEKRRVPKLRFPGFTEDWEQCKLSVLATMNARIGWQNLRTSEFLDNGDYLLITGTDFDNGRIKYSTCHYVEKKRFDQDTKIQLSTGSILITKDGTLGKVALVEELPKPATLNAGVFNVRVKDDAFLSYKYLYHYLKAPFLMKYVTANATGGTIKHLNQSILVDFPIPITGKQEQDRIAKLLDSLESIITLHQRKLNNLKLKKKALLQKLFPKNEERYPELRFPGFTDAWEQRKLNDFGIATGGISIESEFVDGGTYKVINIGSYSEESVYNDQGLRVNKTDKTKSRILNKYDLTMILNDKTASGNIIGRVLLIDQDNTYVYNQRTERIEVDTKDFLPMFLYHMLNAPEQRKYIVKASQGNTQIYVNWSTISNIDYMIPQLLLEQEKIANLFSLINKDITLHQRKLDHLQLQKKALLQQMFV